MDDLVVNGQLLPVVIDDKNTDRPRSVTKGILELTPKMTLVNNLETLLDLTALGHGDQFSIITDVDKSVLLEDGSEKRMENDRGRRVGDHTRFFVKLLGEQVNTEVSVLTSLGRSGDTDDLARAVLKNHEIANADVVARDCKGALVRGVS